MNNLEYIVAAYAITFGSLGLYGVLLWSRLRRLERHLAALTVDEGPPHGCR
jgi:hypothetical protein